MKTTLDKWKQVTVKGLEAQRDRLTAEVESMLEQRDEIGAIIAALGGVGVKHTTSLGQVHWSKKPGVDPKRVAQWKQTMSKAQKKVRNGA